MNAQAVNEYEQDTHWILQLLENIFRPIVQLLYENGIGYPMVRATIKRLYIDVAYEDAAAKSPFKDPTISSMALNTGIDPRDVKTELDSLKRAMVSRTAPGCLMPARKQQFLNGGPKRHPLWTRPANRWIFLFLARG